jgi:hypothetical protein
MNAYQAISAALLTVLLGACAKSEQPVPNKNTNWLERCASDDDCGAALECRCGTCTVTCENDSTCEIGDTRAVCWHEQSEELSGECDGPVGLDTICVPADMVGAEEEPTEKELEDECRSPGSCATVIAEGLAATYALAVDEERVYWLEGTTVDPMTSLERSDGALKSARQSGGDTITLASGLRSRQDLKLDETHAYFTHVAGVRTTSDALSRVPLAGGEVQHIFEHMVSSVGAIELVGSDVLFIGQRDLFDFDSVSIYAAPKDGSLYTNPQQGPRSPEVVAEGIQGFPMALVEVDQELYWHDGLTIRCVDMASDTKSVVVARSSGEAQIPMYAGPLLHHGGHLFWLWSDGAEEGGVASVDLENPEAVRLISGPNVFPPIPLATDDAHVYWAQVDESPPALSIVRTARAADETVALAIFPGSISGQIALSDDYVFVAVAIEDSDDESYIVRFRK